MHEILRHLPPGARVLDLGCNKGSFPVEAYPHLRVVALDYSRIRGVQADAARMPFADASFDAIVSNHSLEHMDRLADVLDEIARVMRPQGALFVAVPDASTFTDRLYRSLHRGGGHVNAFVSSSALATLITEATGLPFVAARTLYSSFGYLERRHFQPRPPRRMWLILNGNTTVIVTLSYILHIVDKLFRTRLSVYGWALYFGTVREPVDPEPAMNVCVRCGTGCHKSFLQEKNLVRLKCWYCPNCGQWNLLHG
jgi:SAM-dependent methyltransferase